MSQRLNLTTASEDATAPVADPAQVALAEQARALVDAVTAYVGTAANGGNTVVNAAFESETSLVIVVHVKPGGRLHPWEAIKVFREVLGQGLQAVFGILGRPESLRQTRARLPRAQ